jgi:hypothetical protein
MPENIYKYERKVTAFEQLFYYSPFSIVTVVTRIKGNITVDMLMNAVEKVQQRHTNLRVRIRTDTEHNPWFTTEGVKEIPIEIISRESKNHWITVHHEASQIPFRFNKRPAIRFILVHSSEISERARLRLQGGSNRTGVAPFYHRNENRCDLTLNSTYKILSAPFSVESNCHR